MSTKSATVGGRSGIAFRIEGTGTVMASASSSFAVSASRTGRPVSSVYIVAPTAHTSVCWSTMSQRARACSGAMNAGVPITEPTRVPPPAPVFPCLTRAMPKSRTFTT